MVVHLCTGWKADGVAFGLANLCGKNGAPVQGFKSICIATLSVMSTLLMVGLNVEFSKLVYGRLRSCDMITFTYVNRFVLD